MERWVELVKAGELPPGQGRTCSAGALRIALFNDGGEYFALDDACPHQGGSLGQGAYHEGRVICPLHAWIFELRTGQCPRATHEGVRTYPTRCVGGAVEVHLPEPPNDTE
jgi:nitrite reductase (NADH) small subunit